MWASVAASRYVSNESLCQGCCAGAAASFACCLWSAVTSSLSALLVVVSIHTCACMSTRACVCVTSSAATSKQEVSNQQKDMLAIGLL